MRPSSHPARGARTRSRSRRELGWGHGLSCTWRVSSWVQERGWVRAGFNPIPSRRVLHPGQMSGGTWVRDHLGQLPATKHPPPQGEDGERGDDPPGVGSKTQAGPSGRFLLSLSGSAGSGLLVLTACRIGANQRPVFTMASPPRLGSLQGRGLGLSTPATNLLQEADGLH